MQNDSAQHLSIALSALGWVVAVIVFAAVLFVGKPLYQNAGYEDGRRVASESNVESVNDFIKHRTIEGEEYVVLGTVVSTTATEVVIETKNPYLLNPLSKERRTQTVRVDAQTILEKRTTLPEAEFFAALEDARERGITTDQALLHRTEPLTLTMLKSGDEIRVYPAVVQDATKDSFYAKQILLVLSSQVQQNPAN